MTIKAEGCGRDVVLNLRGYDVEELWFCDDAGFLTGLKYAWAIASLAVNRSWMQG